MNATDIVLKILLAIVSVSGFWTLLTHLLDSKKKKNEDVLNTIMTKLDVIETKLDKTSDLSLSTARDRVNYLCKRYERLGYIPADENVPFRCLGKSYCEVGNTEVKERFEYCSEHLEVRAEPPNKKHE